MEYHASIFASFETPDKRDDWLLEHGVKQSIPNGGPVFSYSQGNEAKNRDMAQDLADDLDEATDQLEKAVSGGRIDTKAVNRILDRKSLKLWKGE